jgi:hypothetical protein
VLHSVATAPLRSGIPRVSKTRRRPFDSAQRGHHSSGGPCGPGAAGRDRHGMVSDMRRTAATACFLVALAAAPSALAQSVAPCPALPPRAVGIVTDQAAWRGDLAREAARAVTEEVRRLGLAPVTPSSAPLPGQPWACAPLLVVSAASDWPTSTTFVVTITTETVRVSLTLLRPNGETLPAEAAASAAWYSGSLWIPSTSPWVPSWLPIGTSSQQAAEIDAAHRAAAEALRQIEQDITGALQH